MGRARDPVPSPGRPLGTVRTPDRAAWPALGCSLMPLLGYRAARNTRRMGVTAHLNNPHLGVEPGGETACEVQVRNAGSVVDQFTVDVVGFARDWAVIEPPTINLFPGAEATARVLFRPPRSSEVQAGPVPFGVRVLSREDPRGSVVEEGVVDVAPFADLKVELVPSGSTATTSAATGRLPLLSTASWWRARWSRSTRRTS